MVMICQQCGDKGFSNALVYCVKCLEFPVHRYCLDKLPETFDEFVRWLCEDCKPKVPNQSTSHKHGSIPSWKSDHRSLKHLKAIRSTIKLKKKKDTTCLAAETEEHRDQCGPSQQSNEEHTGPDCEPVQLEGGHSLKVKLNKRKHGSIPSLKRDHRSLKRVKTICSTIKLEKKKDTSCLAAETEEHRCQFGPSQRPNEEHTGPDCGPVQLADGHSTLKVKLRKRKDVSRSVAEVNEPRHQQSPSQHPSEAHKELDMTETVQLAGNCFPPKIELKHEKKDITCSVAKTLELRHQSCPSQQPSVAHTRLDLMKDAVLMGSCSALNEERSILLCSHRYSEDLRLKKERRLMLDNGSKFGYEVSQSAFGANNLQHEYRGYAQPVIDPIWRGSFSIINKDDDTYDGFLAHLSSKACQKVIEEASLLPPLLCLEMLPRSDVWPKSFQTSEPSDENIGLYFFPAEKRHERVFDQLVDSMMSQELAMRTTVFGSELLVFTSTELPLLYWRFQGKFFLWGVFRGKQSSHPVNHQLLVPNRNDECFVYSSSANDVGSGERNLTKTKTNNARSPLSPLSNSGEHKLDMDQESESDDR